jgi:hypothetical protein
MKHEAWTRDLRPGTWLEVSQVDDVIKHAVAVGDPLYFILKTSKGLLGCYAPKLDKGFTIAPENVQVMPDQARMQALEQEIPPDYRVH